VSICQSVLRSHWRREYHQNSDWLLFFVRHVALNIYRQGYWASFRCNFRFFSGIGVLQRFLLIGASFIAESGLKLRVWSSVFGVSTPGVTIRCKSFWYLFLCWSFTDYVSFCDSNNRQFMSSFYRKWCISGSARPSINFVDSCWLMITDVYSILLTWRTPVYNTSCLSHRERFIRLMRGVFSSVNPFFNDISPHEPPLQASSSPIPGTRIWSIMRIPSILYLISYFSWRKYMALISKLGRRPGSDRLWWGKTAYQTLQTL